MSGLIAYLIALAIAIPFCAWACRQSWFNAEGITTRRPCVLDEGTPDESDGYSEEVTP